MLKVYDPANLDGTELTRLRERVAELKSEVSSLREITEDLQSSSIQKDDALRLALGAQSQLEVEADLLKVALVWCLKYGAAVDTLGRIWQDSEGDNNYSIAQPPEEIAPLIAEAVKQEREDG